MNQTTIFPGRYVQAEGALEDLGGEAARLGRIPLIIAGTTAVRSIIPRFKEHWLKELDFTSERFKGECSEQEITRLAEIASGLGWDLIVGMGGGKALDTAKTVACELKLPVVIVPTIASTDAPCSAVSVIYSPEGRFERYLSLSSNPDLVLVDTAVIAEAGSLSGCGNGG